MDVENWWYVSSISILWNTKTQNAPSQSKWANVRFINVKISQCNENILVVLSSTTKFKWKNKFVYENVRVTWEIVPIEFFAMNTKLTMLSTLALKTFASSQISYLQSDSICVSLVNSVAQYYTLEQMTRWSENGETIFCYWEKPLIWT